MLHGPSCVHSRTVAHSIRYGLDFPVRWLRRHPDTATSCVAYGSGSQGVERHRSLWGVEQGLPPRPFLTITVGIYVEFEPTKFIANKYASSVAMAAFCQTNRSNIRFFRLSFGSAFHALETAR